MTPHHSVLQRLLYRLEFADFKRSHLPYGWLPNDLGSYTQNSRGVQLFQGGASHYSKIQDHPASEYRYACTSLDLRLDRQANH